MKKERKNKKKIRNLIIICSFCAIILTVSTYAWFIGMKTVNVSSFDIDIATTEGLYLSMDGEKWSYKLDAKNATAYEGNTNQWLDGKNEGLIPVSTVGDMDNTSSTLKLFEKGSLTTTKGGYRLLTSRVNNYTNSEGKYIEGDGYVAFDLFIKNLSGSEYYTENDPLNEEAIYLTTNSTVKISSNGSEDDPAGEAGTGIENSVRVAFAQIGRVKGDTTNASDITSITCSDKESESGSAQVTGICREAQIWEPNDKAHVSNAINWYETSCLKRKSEGSSVTDASSYEPLSTDGAKTNCTTFGTSETKPTYAISRALTISDNVDVYDGAGYNTYTKNTVDYETYKNASDKTSYKLVDFPYFTDTMKDKTGMERPTFMTLAPNSITKVRVYIFIEGQDVDNYDFASLGHKISVNFGFTKERFTESDVDYSGPSTDITPTETSSSASE